jgi:hypothetical protein
VRDELARLTRQHPEHLDIQAIASEFGLSAAAQLAGLSNRIAR